MINTYKKRPNTGHQWILICININAVRVLYSIEMANGKRIWNVKTSFAQRFEVWMVIRMIVVYKSCLRFHMSVDCTLYIVHCTSFDCTSTGYVPKWILYTIFKYFSSAQICWICNNRSRCNSDEMKNVDDFSAFSKPFSSPFCSPHVPRRLSLIILNYLFIVWLNAKISHFLFGQNKFRC